MFDTGLLNDQCREFPLAIDWVKWFPRPLAAQGGYMARTLLGRGQPLAAIPLIEQAMPPYSEAAAELMAEAEAQIRAMKEVIQRAITGSGLEVDTHWNLRSAWSPQLLRLSPRLDRECA